MTSNRRIRFAKFLLAAGLLCGAAVFPMVASANDNPGVCSGTHLYPADDDTKSIEVTAPDGQLISGYCVKAGSIKQGDGPEYVVVDPPVKTVTISHSSGKDISHYTVTFVDEPDGTTTTTTPDGTTTTTVPETTTTTEPPTLIPPVVVKRAVPAQPATADPTFTG